MSDGTIDFGFFPRKDGNITNWILRVEREIDDYILFNGRFTDAACYKFCQTLEDLMTNPNGQLMGMLLTFLSQKLKLNPSEVTLNHLMELCNYLKARMEQKITPQLQEYRQQLLPERKYKL